MMVKFTRKDVPFFFFSPLNIKILLDFQIGIPQAWNAHTYTAHTLWAGAEAALPRQTMPELGMSNGFYINVINFILPSLVLFKRPPLPPFPHPLCFPPSSTGSCTYASGDSLLYTSSLTPLSTPLPSFPLQWSVSNFTYVHFEVVSANSEKCERTVCKCPPAASVRDLVSEVIKHCVGPEKTQEIISKCYFDFRIWFLESLLFFNENNCMHLFCHIHRNHVPL